MYLGVDLTPPDKVRNLAPSFFQPQSPQGWTEARRVNLVWTRPTGIADNYDRLSGVGGYSVAFDGGPEVAFVTNTAPDPGFEPYADVINANLSGSHDPQVANATIENLPAGAHIIGVTTVDRATNRSLSAAVVTSKVDYDTPSGYFKWTNEAVTPWRLGRTGTVSVVTSDLAGISAVSFYMDDAYIGQGVNKGSGVWSLTRDFSAFGDGSHVVKAVIQDMIGLNSPTSGVWTKQHTATVTQAMTLEKSAPKARVSSSSYRRKVTLKVKGLTESAKMVITIDGKAYAAKSVKRSTTYTQSHTVAKRTSGSRTRGVKWSVKLTDDYGNSTTYNGKSTVTYYRLKKLANNKVKLYVY